MTSHFRQASKTRPCAICKGTGSGCKESSDGLVLCRRHKGEVAGFRYLGQAKKDPQWAEYRREDDPAQPDRRHERNGHPRASAGKQQVDWEARARQCWRALTPALRDELAGVLGVPPAALADLAVGWCPDERCWTFPEQNGAGRVVGLLRRFRDGSKKAAAGGARGLLVPDGWQDREGPVLVPEGPSDVLVLASMGLAAVGRPSNTAGVDDLAGLLGALPAECEAIVLGEHDEKADGRWPGMEGAKFTAAALTARLRRPVAWALPPGKAKDAREWLGQQRPDLSDAGQLHELGRTFLAGLQRQHAKADAPGSPEAAELHCYRPFPLNTLPQPFRGLVVAGAAAIGCDPALVAVPLLVAQAAAVGNSRRVELKRGWSEPAILWAANVGESGALKSPALDLALSQTRERQSAAIRLWKEEMAAYEDERNSYEEALAEWRRTKGKSPKPSEPDGDEPVCERSLVSDTTVESLAIILQDAPRGLLLGRDELSGWVSSFNSYKPAGKGGDVAHWLEMHRGGQLLVDRKSGAVKLIHAPRAAVSVVGGVQPETLRRVLGREHFEDGLAARLLLCMPPRRVRRWTEADIDPDLERQVGATFDRLYSLEMAESEEGDPTPVALRLTPDGKEAWVSFFTEHAREQVELSGDLAATWSKLEGYAARFALVIQCARWAATGKPPEGPPAVDARSVEAGATLSRWFGQEARRVYSVLSESDEAQDRRQLVEWIERKGGSVTARELQMGNRRYRRSAEATEQALDELVKAGLGRWVEISTTAKGGQPTRQFELVNGVNVNGTPPNPEDFGGSVDVDTVDRGQDAEAGNGPAGPYIAPGADTAALEQPF
jgi:hypothetical protein